MPPSRQPSGASWNRSSSVSRPAPGRVDGNAARTLLLALDAVPYRVSVEAVFQRGVRWQDAATHASTAPWGRWRPPRRLDYIFVQQPRVTRWRVSDTHHLDAPGGPHSDHRAVLARLLPAG